MAVRRRRRSEPYLPNGRPQLCPPSLGPSFSWRSGVVRPVSMPKYFFHTHGLQPSEDDRGEVLPDDEAAWHEATLVAGEIFKDIDGKFRPEQEWCLEVTDAQRKPLYAIRINSKQIK